MKKGGESERQPPPFEIALEARRCGSWSAHPMGDRRGRVATTRARARARALASERKGRNGLTEGPVEAG